MRTRHKTLELEASVEGETEELSEREAQFIGDNMKTSETIFQKINRIEVITTYTFVPFLTRISRGYFSRFQFNFVISKHVCIDPRT